jgi:transcriptional regulator with XRE-family HTH domain
VARRPNPSKLNQPLRLLRSALSEVGDARYPITQEELADLIGLSPGTIKGLENGHREMTDTIWLRVAVGTGAVWNPKKKRWVCAPGFGKAGQPYTRAFFLEFRERRNRRPQEAEMIALMEMSRLIALFKKVPDKDWYLLFFKVNRFLEACGQEFGIKEDLLDPEKAEELRAWIRDPKVPHSWNQPNA